MPPRPGVEARSLLRALLLKQPRQETAEESALKASVATYQQGRAPPGSGPALADEHDPTDKELAVKASLVAYQDEQALRKRRLALAESLLLRSHPNPTCCVGVC